MKKKSTTRITVIIVIGIIAMVGYYTYLSNKTREQKQEAALSEVQSVLSRDLAMDYPPTPKEVIKYYNELLKCMYHEETTEAEIEDLGNKARELYDAELLENNELGVYLVNLYADIDEFKESKRMFTSFSVASSTNVDFFDEDGYSFARIRCNYNIAENGVTCPSDQIYLLRQDENKQWKIYGWQPADQVKLEN